MGEGRKDKWEPRSLRPFADAAIIVFIICIAIIVGFVLLSLPMLRATVATKAAIVVLSCTSLYGAISVLMWSRHWRNVQWDVSFWSFVSGPLPEDEDARRAWYWGRRFRASWALGAACIGFIALAETLAKTW